MNLETARFYLTVLIRRLPIVIAACVLCGIGGGILLAVLPPVYRASATILMEPPQIAPDLARSTVPSDTIEQLGAIEKEMFVRENLLDLAYRFGLYRHRAPRSPEDIVADLSSRIRVEFVRLGAPQAGVGATAFAVSFDHSDPELATRVVDHLVAMILDENVRRRTGRADATLRFFDQEVKELSAELARTESDILTFKNANLAALPDSLDFRRSQQSSQHERLNQLDREEAGLRNRRETLIEMWQTTGSPRPATERNEQLAALRTTLEARRAVFAEESPSIVSLKARIAQLDGKTRSTDPAAKADRDEPPADMKMQLADIDGRLTFIAQEKAAIAGTLAALDGSIAATPGNETTLNQLTRTYESLKARYLAAVERHAEAATGALIETRAKGERLTVIEPAIAPERPIRPRRLAVMALSIAAGLGAGLGIVVLLELLNGTVRRPAEMIDRLGLQPLVTVPYIDAPNEGFGRRLSFAIILVGTAGTAGLALALVHIYLQPLDAVAGRLLGAFGLPSLG